MRGAVVQRIGHIPSKDTIQVRFLSALPYFVLRNILHSSGTASDSICPKGWRLPGNEGEKSYVEMLKLYSNRNGNTSDLTQGDTVAMLTQLAFLRSGDYNYSSGSLSNRTSYGYYWSGHYYSVTDSHLLYFGSTVLNPQSGSGRGYGFALRCLAR